MNITTLIEDSKGEHLGLKNEHGISFFIETEYKTILFDTGQSRAFIENAKTLGLDLNLVDTVVISHGHYDHSGGFRSLVEEIGSKFDFYIHKSFFKEKYGYDGISYQYLGNNFDLQYLEKNKIKTHFVDEPMIEIAPGIILITQFERKNPFEKINPRFYMNQGTRYELDQFEDEVMLAIDSKDGWIVLLGCSHPGVINMLDELQRRTNKPIYGIIGGTHLKEADFERMKKTLEYFDRLKIRMIGISHCTGEEAAKLLKERFEDRYFHNTTGTSIRLK